MSAEAGDLAVGPASAAAAFDDAWQPASAEEAFRVERFLYDEAELLDAWELEQWLELVDDGVRYVVPTTDAREGDPDQVLAFVNDDIVRLRARVARLTSRRAWREYPTSRTRRILSNVRVDKGASGSHYWVQANFVVYRFRSRRSAEFVGRLDQVLVRREQGLRIAYRRAVLDLEALEPHGAVSVIL